ncbi:hypothetical protein [Spongiibacter tropicus]|uniref:hypothetical protein n=1 Tax=Spongiibacter tropicus TaxID=454602 RepID=UPI0023566D7F|nr:hypothetical protein [Spongiibacter tropicus]|tara:strand:- start:61579 stop:61860 length:282 start_codon:yes stop_codon:yes gene_type:complete
MLSKFLLRDFSSLQSRYAIVFGWALESPVLVQMNQLPEHHRLKSDDPDFWAVCSGQDGAGEKVDREVDWKVVAEDWQKVNLPDRGESSEQDDE